jgi:hypothetical protein
MARLSQKKTVPQEIITQGETDEVYLKVTNGKTGSTIFAIKGDGTPTFKTLTALTAATVAPASFTHTAPSVADYLIQAPVQNTGFGFVTADEMNSTLAVLKNAITRIAELEARLKSLGILP